MNKKAQAQILVFICCLFIFIFIWATWLGGFLQEQAGAGIDSGYFTGWEAFMLANINLFIFLGLILAIFFGIYFGLGSGN